MFTITYLPPYSVGARTQSFPTLEAAASMCAFYRSCGTKAWIN